MRKPTEESLITVKTKERTLLSRNKPKESPYPIPAMDPKASDIKAVWSVIRVDLYSFFMPL